MSFFNPFRGTPSKEAGKPKAASGAGSPLELISYDTQTGKFQLGSKALEVLRSVSFKALHAECLCEVHFQKHIRQMSSSGVELSNRPANLSLIQHSDDIKE